VLAAAWINRADRERQSGGHRAIEIADRALPADGAGGADGAESLYLKAVTPGKGY
jgi:hypothetical protein